MDNRFVVKKGLFVQSAGAQITGSVFSDATITASGFFGPLTGTSSWATNVVNAGASVTTGSTYPITASWTETASYAKSASYGINFKANVIDTGNITGSFAQLTKITASAIAALANGELTIGGGSVNLPLNISLAAYHNDGGGDNAGGSIYIAAGNTTAGGGTGGNVFIDAGLPDTATYQTGSVIINAVNSACNVGISENNPATKLHVQGNISASRVFATASLAISASWAPGGQGTSLTTGSTYPITASWANTASYGSSFSASSISSSTVQANSLTVGTIVSTGGTIQVNSNIALNAGSNTIGGSTLSHNTTDINYGEETTLHGFENNWTIGANGAAVFNSTVQSVGGFLGTASYSTSGSYAKSASWATNVINGSPAAGTMVTGSTYPITASWAISASFVPTASHFYQQSGSGAGAWRIYVDQIYGDLVFQYA